MLFRSLEPQVLDLDSALGMPGAIVERPQEEATDAPFQHLSDAVDDCQRQKILNALSLCGENWAGAARLLDVDPSNLHKLARRLRLK